MERDGGERVISGTWLISIHALRMERDRLSFYDHWIRVISIHALRMERDFSELVINTEVSNFNPRAPHGARHL